MSNSLQFGVRFGAVVCVASVILWGGCASEEAARGPEKSAPQSAPAQPTALAEADKGTTAPPPAAVTAAPEAPKAASTAERLKEAAARASAPFEGEGWTPLFDGESLKGWRETTFAGRGEVTLESGLIVLNMGDPFTGLNYTNEFPKMNYEVAFDAMRVMGSDFFCGLTVPVDDTFCSLIVGGWGGGLLGISSLDGMDASENETTKYLSFEQGRWYRIRLRITPGRIEGWIDNEKLINVLTTDRKVSTRPGDIELSKPFGVASWQTTGALRNLKLRKVDKPDGPPKKY